MTAMNQKDEKSHFLLFRILQCHLMVVRILKILCLKRPMEVCSLISESPPLEQEMVTGAFSNLFFYNSREGGAGGQGEFSAMQLPSCKDFDTHCTEKHMLYENYALSDEEGRAQDLR